MNTTTGAVDIMLIEDNPGDVRLVQHAFKDKALYNLVSIARDGEEAMAKLTEASLPSAHRPDLILLDLNLPKRHGREVLEWIKTHPALKHIPVVILTSSRDADDILRSYQSHANCYITKPGTLAQFTQVVSSIEQFWLGIAALPRV